MTKILIYSHDTFGLGNVRRMLTIAMHLADRHRDLSILLISGSPMLHAFRIPPQIDYVKLPCLVRTRAGQYLSQYLGLGFEEVIRLRANIILSTALDFQPDLLLVDKKPLGLGGELAPTLEALNRRARRPRQVLLLRDILDSPQVTSEIWRKNRYFDVLESCYDRILVVGLREVFDMAAEYGFPASVAEKLHYCGYLERSRGRRSPAEVRRELGVGGERLVLVTAGGGADGAELLSCYLEGLQTRQEKAPLHSLLLCGPGLAEAQRRKLEARAAAQPRVHVREFTDDLMSYMAACDAVVSMAGYNTICEILTLNKPAVVVPRVMPVKEQWIRAQRLAALGLVQAIEPDLLTPTCLMAALEGVFRYAEAPVSGPYRIDLGGLGRIERSLLELAAPVPGLDGGFPAGVMDRRFGAWPMAEWGLSQ